MSDVFDLFANKKKFGVENTPVIPFRPTEEPNPMGRNSPNVQKQANNTANAMVNNIQPNIAPVSQELPGAPTYSAPDVTNAAVTTAPQDVKNLIKELPGDDTVKSQVSQLVDNPEQFQQFSAKVQQKKTTGQPVGMVDSFVDALSFFLPTALGAVVGTAVGGAETGVAAADTATALTGQYRQYNMDRAKMQQAQDIANRELQMQYGVPKFDATPQFMDTRTGNSVTTLSKPGQPPIFVEVGTGKEVSADTVKPLSLYQAEYTQNQIAGRQDENLNARLLKDQENALKAFSNNKDMQKTKDSVGAMDQIMDLVNSGLPITQDFLAPLMARGVLEQVGVLTEQDSTRSKIPMDFFQKNKNKISEALMGKMTPEAKTAVINMISRMRQEALRRAHKRIDGFASQDRVKRLGFTDRQSLVDQLSAQSGFDFNDFKSQESDKQNAVSLTPEKKAKVSEIKDRLKNLKGK